MSHAIRIARNLLCSATISVVLFSCQSSRLSAGFSYHGSDKAPDVGSSGQYVADAHVTRPMTSAPVAAKADQSPDAVEALVAAAPAEKKDEARVIAQAMKEELAANAQNGVATTHQQLVHSVTEKLVRSGQIEPISSRKMRQLDKMALQMDKKAQKQGPSIDMKNMSGLEWFFLIMAAAGLVLGIIGVSLGWLVLVVFGGLFLYWKLVQDK
jgi:hypothetical protein